MAALLGKEAEAPFDEIHQVINEVLSSAQMLVEQVGQPREDRDFWRKLEGHIWGGSRKPDEIEDQVLKAIASMESICRPALSLTHGRLQS